MTDRVRKDEPVKPGIVEVSLEEWEALTPDKRRSLNISAVRMPDGVRLPVYMWDWKRLVPGA
jgi:hypothetical protein